MIKRFIPIIVGVVLATVAALLSAQYLRGREAQMKKKFETERAKFLSQFKAPVEVVVAKRAIDKGMAIAVADLAIQTMPGNFVQPNATSRPADVLGQVTLVPLGAGEQVLTNKVSPPDQIETEGKTLSSVTPMGKRAVTIGVDALSGVGGLVRPGDTVDVFSSFQAPDREGQEVSSGPVTVTLFQGVKVLAVGDQKIGERAHTEESGAAAVDNSRVTLSLSPQESALLMFARERGDIHLSLRAGEDSGQQVAINPTDIYTMVESVLGEKVDRPGGPKREVEVYKGQARSVVPLND